jgi:hypothetical protein
VEPGTSDLAQLVRPEAESRHVAGSEDEKRPGRAVMGWRRRRGVEAKIEYTAVSTGRSSRSSPARSRRHAQGGLGT